MYIEREQTCTTKALLALDALTWVEHQLKVKSRVFLINGKHYFYKYHETLANSLCSKAMPVFDITQSLCVYYYLYGNGTLPSDNRPSSAIFEGYFTRPFSKCDYPN